MTISISRRNVVRGEAVLRLPMASTTAWGQLRDFHRFAAQDHFHAEIHVQGRVPRQGASLVMKHRYLGFGVTRVGRILFWRENEGFAFSDLSRQNRMTGFPHVLRFRLQPIDPGQCTLRITVGGRWTSPLPRWLGRLWMGWVFGQIVRSTENQLLAFAVFARKKKK